MARSLRRQGRPLLLVSAHWASQIPPTHPAIGHLPDAELLEQIRSFGGTPDVVLHNSELMNLLLPALRANFHMVESYEYCNEPPLACPITAYGGGADRIVSAADLDAWSLQSRGEFQCHIFPGGHFYLQSESRQVLAALKTDLHRAIEEKRGRVRDGRTKKPRADMARGDRDSR